MEHPSSEAADSADCPGGKVPMERRRILVVAAALVAVLGVVLVLLYVRGSDNRAKAQYEFTQVLVATQSIAQGETFGDAVSAGKLNLENVVASDKIAGAITSLTAIQNNEVAQASIYPGEQVLGSRFGSATSAASVATPNLAIPDGDVAISLSLTDPGRVASFVQPGSNVVIFATTPQGPTGSNGGPNASGFSRVLVPKVLVVAVGSTSSIAAPSPSAGASSSSSSSAALPPTLMTVAVTQQQAEQIELAQADSTPAYTLAFGLLNDKSKITPGAKVDFTNIFGK